MNMGYGDYSLQLAQQHMAELAQKAERRRLVAQARRESRAAQPHHSFRPVVSVRWVRGLVAAALHTLPS
jgi:hypothetical protein